MLNSETRHPRRILVITTSYPRFPGDSAGHFVETEVRGLLESGHKVTVLAAGTRSRAPQSAGEHRRGLTPEVVFLGGRALFDHPGALLRLQENPLRVLAGLRVTAKVMARHLGGKNGPAYDQVIAHWLFPSALPWSWLGCSLKTPLEVVIHGTDLLLLLGMPRPLRNSLLQGLLAREASLRFVSAQQKLDLLSSNLPGQLHDFVSSARVQTPKLDLPTRLTRSVARARLALPDDERWAVFVGRLVVQKRPETALTAAELVPHLNTAVLGDGPLGTSLRDKFPNARFLGQLPRQQALLWIAAADLCLSASRLEGAPTAIREARHLGTAVVTSNSGDCKQWGRADPDLWVVD